MKTKVKAGQIRVMVFSEYEPPFKVLFVGLELVLIKFLDMHESAYTLEELEDNSILFKKRKKV